MSFDFIPPPQLWIIIGITFALNCYDLSCSSRYSCWYFSIFSLHIPSSLLAYFVLLGMLYSKCLYLILRQIWSSCCSVYDDGCCSNQFDVPNPTNIFCYCSHILWRFSHLSLNHKPFFSDSTVSIFSTLSCLRTYSVDTSFLHPYNRCYTLSLSSPFSLSYLWLSSKLLSPASIATCWI